MKGTQWVVKTPRLKCRCGCTLHFECRGRWVIKYDSPASNIPSLYSPAIDEQEPPPRAEDDSDG